MDKQFVTIGRVGKPFGLRGEFYIESYADSLLLFAPATRLYLGGSLRPRRIEVHGRRLHKNRLVLRLKGINGREQAEALRGRDILIRERDLPEPNPDEVLVRDLLDCTVELPDGRIVGRIEQVQNNAGQEVWTIRGEGGEEILFPVAEPFLRELDVKRKRIVVDPPPGLIELYVQGKASQP